MDNAWITVWILSGLLGSVLFRALCQKEQECRLKRIGWAMLHCVLGAISLVLMVFSAGIWITDRRWRND